MKKFLELNTLSLAIFGVTIFGILKYFFEKFENVEILPERGAGRFYYTERGGFPKGVKPNL